jgi:LacI family transcriptional regulator
MNIYDIAEESGVSISTVSRVLNNKSNVKPATRKKVEAVLSKHDYSPSAIARGLVSKSLNTVGILTIDIRVPHYAASAYILEHELYKIGYNAILCNTSGKPENASDYIHMLLKKGVSGIFLIGSVFQSKDVETSLIKNAGNVPFIILNSQLSAGNTYSVLMNHESGMRLALSHLRERGHNHIAYVQDADTFSGKRKTAAFIKLMEEDRDQHFNNYVFKCNRGVKGGRDATSRIIGSEIDFTAVIYGDDTTAIGGLQEIHKRGLKVPDDYAIVGWNNTESKFCEPNLTTVDNQDEMAGVIVIKMLENLLEGISISPNVYIDSSLVIREST